MLQIDINGLEKVQAFLGGIHQGTERAITTGINKTLIKLKAVAKKRVTQEYAIKSGEIEKTLSIKKANFSSLGGTLVSKSPLLPVMKFLKGSKGPDLRVMVKKSDGMKILSGKAEYDGRPFTATMKSSHKGVFQRKGKKPYPIKELYSLSIPQMLGHQDMQEYIQKEGGGILENMIMHEVNRILKGYL